MDQSTWNKSDAGLHVAIIMDGNGRWATARGWPRVAGHRAGGETVRRVVECAPRFGIGMLTLFAFSSDNWRRPRREVGALLDLLAHYLRDEIARCVSQGVRVAFIGRRDRLPPRLVRAMEAAESATAVGHTLRLRIALDYSGRDAIVRAAGRLEPGAPVSRDRFERMLAAADDLEGAARAVDLLIRTGGERRLSDFLLWESAYAELHFTPVLWPDFMERDLEAAVLDFQGRQRRFGGLPRRAAS